MLEFPSNTDPVSIEVQQFLSERLATTLNPVLASEIADGERSDIADPYHEDPLDRLCAEFNRGSVDKPRTTRVVNISEADMAFVGSRVASYAIKKGIHGEKFDELVEPLAELSRNLYDKMHASSNHTELAKVPIEKKRRVFGKIFGGSR